MCHGRQKSNESNTYKKGVGPGSAYTKGKNRPEGSKNLTF